MKKIKLITAITGASGIIYAKLLIEKINEYSNQVQENNVIISRNARQIWKHELKNTDYKKFPFNTYGEDDFYAPFASGSNIYDTMIICPCSMNTLGKIANGVTDNLIIRTADVMLKERRKVILVTRETPLNLIHIQNMLNVTQAGAIVCPACPAFYLHPHSIDELLNSIVDRILELAGLNISTKRWCA